MSSSQCSCTFHCKMCTELLHSSCYASHGLATHTVFFSFTLLNFFGCAFYGFTTCTAFSTPFFSIFFHSGHSLHLCSFSPYLKHSTTQLLSIVFCLLNSTPHFITLLANTSNLFWGTNFPFSFFSFL